MPHPRHAARLATLLASLWGACLAPAQAAPGDISFDFANSHPYLGFGTQVWLNNKDTRAASKMLQDLNARYVRVSLTPKILLSQLKPDLTVEQASALIKANDNPEQRERFTAFRDQMKALNIEPVLIFWKMPEPWVETKNKRAGQKAQSNFAKPEFFDAYVNTIVAQMLYSTQLGIAPAAVELINEPHGAWATKFSDEEYATLALKARATMDRYGLQKIRIAGPGANLKNFDHFIGGLKAKNALGTIGFASAHVYTTPDKLADSRQGDLGSFVGRGKFGPVMITEFNVKGNDEDSPLASEKRDNATPAFGLAAGADAVLLIGHGASALIYWQLQDFNWQKRNLGMISDSGERRPVAQVMQALFSALPRGGKAVGTQTGVANLYATALQEGDKTYLMLANLNDKPQAVNASFKGGTDRCGSVERITGYAMNGEAASALKGASARNCQFQGTLAPGSVATVVLR